MYKPITILVAKVAFVLLMFLVLASCKNDHSKREIKKPVAPQKEAAKIIQSNFQEMIDTNLVKGSILLYDPQLNKYYCNDFEDAKKKTLPASTFKIPNSIIALETSVIKEISDTIKWDGQVQAFKIWEQDMTFAEAYKYSCLPCYRQLTRSQTTASMSEWLKKMEYPGMKFDSSDLDIFWVLGNSGIDQFEQIDFLQRLYYKKLPISQKTHAILEQIMINKTTEDYTIRGKTGWVFSDDKEQNIAWYIGFIDFENAHYYFATRLKPTSALDMDKFPGIRKELTIEAFKQMRWIKNH